MPIELEEKNELLINDNNLLEELEKNKYYYDIYETNYLYKEKENENNKIINNYSIYKMKEINYFSLIYIENQKKFYWIKIWK